MVKMGDDSGVRDIYHAEKYAFLYKATQTAIINNDRDYYLAVRTEINKLNKWINPES